MGLLFSFYKNKFGVANNEELEKLKEENEQLKDQLQKERDLVQEKNGVNVKFEKLIKIFRVVSAVYATFSLLSMFAVYLSYPVISVESLAVIFMIHFFFGTVLCLLTYYQPKMDKNSSSSKLASTTPSFIKKMNSSIPSKKDESASTTSSFMKKMNSSIPSKKDEHIRDPIHITSPIPITTTNCPSKCGELNKSKVQKDIYPGTKFIAPCNIPDSNSSADGLVGKVTGLFGYLFVDPTISKGIWHCAIRFVENRGFCRVGILGVSKEFPMGDLDSPKGNLAYDNMGNYVQSPTNTVSSRKGWKKDQCVTLEIDMDKRQICFFVDGVLQNFVFTDIPEIVRVYTWNVNPSIVHIIKFAKVSSSTKISERMVVLKWES